MSNLKVFIPNVVVNNFEDQTKVYADDLIKLQSEVLDEKGPLLHFISPIYSSTDQLILESPSLSKPESARWGCDRIDYEKHIPRAHHGIDIDASIGTPVLASEEGVVESYNRASGYGNILTIKHRHDYKTRYAHLASTNLKPGGYCSAGRYHCSKREY